ncbi:hypothetical protein GUJ93_ZPchr0004g39090 [Zizania palustris]|uniref:Uncharacterized protein n=1 Tax=Zizania palustris TaxID=103762 RepID=A0A8J5SPP2_ZIZPA|nr:hypothetical protein GUJ93_ZPchr0004g39090 [Zizania palustris]
MTSVVPTTYMLVFVGTTDQQKAKASGSSSTPTTSDEGFATPSTEAPTSVEVAASKPMLLVAPPDPSPMVEISTTTDVEMPLVEPEVTDPVPLEDDPIVVRVEGMPQPTRGVATNIPNRVVGRGMTDCLEALKRFNQEITLMVG